MKYRTAWWWLKGLDEIMIEPFFAFCSITWNWWRGLPSRADVTPKYLNLLIVCNCCIVRLIMLLEAWFCIVLCVVFLLKYRSLLSVNSQVIRYNAYFASSKAPPKVWSICSQLLDALCKLSPIIFSEFLSNRWRIVFYHQLILWCGLCMIENSQGMRCRKCCIFFQLFPLFGYYRIAMLFQHI